MGALAKIIVFFFSFKLARTSIRSKAIVHNAIRVKEVKGACRMFRFSTTLDAPFISFNLMLSAVFS